MIIYGFFIIWHKPGDGSKFPAYLYIIYGHVYVKYQIEKGAIQKYDKTTNLYEISIVFKNYTFK